MPVDASRSGSPSSSGGRAPRPRPGSTAPSSPERLRSTREQGLHAAEGPPLLLAGGLRAWQASDGPLSPVPGDVPRFLDASAGEIDRDEFPAMWNEEGHRGALFVDVRAMAGAAWARHLPLERLASGLAALPRDRELVLFCAVGKRSRMAWEVLKGEGFRVRYLRGIPPP